MIIKSIEIKNFQCYWGTNKFEFSEGLNVIIGDNGSGKSKLYDAFYWVMYDEIFDTNKEKFTGTKYFGENFVSDKAKYECSIDNSVVVSVCTVFEDPFSFERITFERTFETTRIEENKWAYSPQSKLVVFYQERGPLSSKKVIDKLEEIEKFKQKILPDRIKPYMWFQGEAVNSLIDFEKSETLQNAINILSDISEYDEIISVAKIALESAESDLKRENKRNSSDTSKTERLSEDQSQLIREKDRLDVEISQYSINIAEYENRVSSIINSFDDAQKISHYELDKKNKLNLFNEQEEIYNRKQVQLNRSLFDKKWVLKNSEELIKLYSDKFNHYQKEKLRKENQIALMNNVEKKLQTRLPVNVPQPIYVQDMLDREICLVCNREATKESEAWLAIKELLNDPDLLKDSQKVTAFKQDFRSEFSTLYEKTLEMKGKISNIDDDILSVFQDLQEVDQRRKSYKQDFEFLEKQIEKLVEDTAISVETSRGIIDELKDKQERISNEKNLLKQNENKKASILIKLDEIDKEINRLSRDKTPEIFQKKVGVLHDFKLIAESTRERVYHNLVMRLQEEANKHFKHITKESNSYQGIIKLVKDNQGKYLPENQNNRGEKITQLNASNISIIKLCVIMAIISEKKTAESTKLYTFITDAPMSIFGQNYTIGFCKSTNEVYKQSIIMSKDFYGNDALTERLLKEVRNLGNVYKIEPSSKENERSNRNSLFTKISIIRQVNEND